VCCSCCTTSGEHRYKEDFGLFPAAIATLDGADWDAMEQWESEHLAAAAAPISAS
jgi:hypothetical protein